MPIGVRFTLADMDKAGGNPMLLIETDEMPRIAGVHSPSDLYWVLKSPAPLAGMRYPRPDFPWRGLSAVGLSGVVALAPGSYDPSPLKLLFWQRLEDLCHGGNPSDPKKEERLIADAVEITLRSLRSGQGVVVHCIGGRGRTGTVLGAVLRRLGDGFPEVLGYLNRIHKARGKPGWPESQWQSAFVERGTIEKLC
jgi:polymorphic toxin system DSP-PTPase phosphatase-like protein